MRRLRICCLFLFTACLFAGCGGGIESGIPRDATAPASVDLDGGVKPQMNAPKGKTASNTAGL